jgi:hypothetical protein
MTTGSLKMQRKEHYWAEQDEARLQALQLSPTSGNCGQRKASFRESWENAPGIEFEVDQLSIKEQQPQQQA